MAIPIFKDDNKNFMLFQNQVASQLNPVLRNPLTAPSLLSGISLKTGKNVINTLLGRTTQGWMIADVDAAVTVYRSAPFNDLTLTLTSSGPATVALVIF